MINNKNDNYLNKIFTNINTNYYVYYNIIFSLENTQMTIYTLKDSPFFGNLTYNDFNEALIYNETKIITLSNLYTVIGTSHFLLIAYT